MFDKLVNLIEKYEDKQKEFDEIWRDASNLIVDIIGGDKIIPVERKGENQYCVNFKLDDTSMYRRSMEKIVHAPLKCDESKKGKDKLNDTVDRGKYIAAINKNIQTLAEASNIGSAGRSDIRYPVITMISKTANYTIEFGLSSPTNPA